MRLRLSNFRRPNTGAGLRSCAREEVRSSGDSIPLPVPQSSKHLDMKRSGILKSAVRLALFSAGVFCFFIASGEPLSGVTFRRWLAAFLILITISAACFYALYRISGGNNADDDNTKT